MSYDIDIVDKKTKEVIKLDTPHHITGGTYVIGGTNELSMNITFNYSKIIYKVLEGGIKGLDGKTVSDTIPLIEKAILSLKDDVTANYWESTEGNAKRALTNLLTLAKHAPNGEWAIWY